ncbi:hypothetical protein M9Y10_037912 [Tritrichomonas musculus]|uniref:Uncharacterized protein n=1 Tax=Tritrichomonas musculus TaxID=1915356 RepID=A0ABR2K745_9EUKA
MNNYEHATNEIILVPVPGVWISSQSIQPAPAADLENSKTTFELFKPKRYSSDNENFCIVPAMPAVPPFIDESDLKEALNNIEISAPLKGRESPYSNKKSRGYRSGRRSCVVPCRKINFNQVLSSSDWVIGTDGSNGSKYIVDFENGDELIRVKGCGMWLPDDDLPFPAITLQESESRHAPEGCHVSEIRGVCFENTACTESSATNQISEVLAKFGILSGNYPLGFWIYKDIQNDIAPLITKTVSIFKTLGDRRLESHLLTGFEKLLSKKYDQTFANGVIESIMPLYENMKERFPSNNFRTTLKIHSIDKSAINAKIKDGSFFCFEDFDFENYRDDDLRKRGIIPTYEIYKALEHIDNDFVNLLKLYGRIGFEVGRILSLIHRAGYLWGSFTDHNEYLFHCNAHCDNLVVLSKEKCLSNKNILQILAPIDFDMAFKKESAINTWRQTPFPDSTYVTANIPAEFLFMMEDVGGSFATFENASNFFKPRPQPPGLLVNLLWLLRDCGVYEFCQGYQKIHMQGCKGNDISVDDIYKLIQEGLNETIDLNS